jgi:transposase
MIHTHDQVATHTVAMGAGVAVWLATQPVDMRRSFDGLAEHVRAFLGHDPLSGSMFVFRNRAGHMLKILWWDENGLAIYYKRLERGTFQFPRAVGDANVAAIDSAAMMRLLRGMKLEASPVDSASTRPKRCGCTMDEQVRCT